MKSYTIKLTTSDHGNFGDEKRALVNALNDLINQIGSRDDMPPDGELGHHINGAYVSATIYARKLRYFNDGKPR